MRRPATLAVPPAPAAAEGARSALAGQAAAWNRGDLDGALKAYWADEGLTFVHHGGVTHGYAAFADGIRAQFGAPARMGHYSVDVLDARDIKRDAALIVVRWSIVGPENQTIGGVSTQLWEKRRDAWVITYEHA